VRSVEHLKVRLKKPELKFDLVCHSMGGIIARYAAMYGDVDVLDGTEKLQPTWAGARHFDKIILLGSPFRGTPTALSTLVNGFTLGGVRIDLPFVQDTSRFTAFTIPTAYQLLPAPGALRAYNDRLEPFDIDLYDPKVWTKYGWNPIDDKDFAKEFKGDAVKTAPTFFAAALTRARRLYEALAAPAKDRSVSFHVVASDCKTAPDAIVVYRSDNTWKTLFRPKGFTRADGVKIRDDELKKVISAPGDDVVSRRSVEGAGEVDSIKFICGEHYKLAASTMIQDHILGLLSGRIVPVKPVSAPAN
jgi:hypothetical protein